MKKLILIFLISFPILGDEKRDLADLAKRIEKYNESFIKGVMVTSEKDEEVRSVNYYTKEGDFKRTVLKQTEKKEYIEKWGDRRRWFVSKWQGKQPAIYVSASYNGNYELENNLQSKDLKDDYRFYFKNYCEFDGIIDTRYARIKKMRLTYFDAPYTAVNNMMNIKISSNFKKIVSYDIDLKEDDKVINAMQSFKPVKSTTWYGNIFAIQLKVLEVYPGEKDMPLCTSDYYMGYKGWGSYEDVLKQIDELPELKGKRNPY
ncbi:Hypothetical protein LBF_1387 [Leptospira biflexa serovar Patoc strain 'Patoc 1 (Ames)']|uniref:Uncharacterized protein n=1 Tax=Leptospira biflexa serovar Patoc (strain Patoc 1 / ATCC 23582 / Paris) TaxID=456481 RepID=B0SPY2_LEPBP|nr:hypothetical protein [Leptospira biflexa]ABZ93904.1 Hypothetical protein LBF_1387 [Leptospira biflexa serovar Patoc strain 'Patoc 1 (Ames)']ABZ97548.1 Hypothetical protein; putative signal peptide [Leptospira biflexa serovar Patoc strain 'Patoc 1 (Paris)']